MIAPEYRRYALTAVGRASAAVGLAVTAVRHDGSRAGQLVVPRSLAAPLLTAVHMLISGHAQSRPASFGDG